MTPADKPMVRLLEPDEAPYREYRGRLVQHYAQDKILPDVRSGAEGEAAQGLGELLPDGPATRGHFRDGRRTLEPVEEKARELGAGRGARLRALRGGAGAPPGEGYAQTSVVMARPMRAG